MVLKLRDERVAHSFLISEIFPSDDPIAIDLLRLMSACNDQYFIEEWVNGTKHTAKDKLAMLIAIGRQSLQVRLIFSVLYESLLVLRELNRRPEFKAIEPWLDEEGRNALQSLLSVKLTGLKPDKQNWDFSSALNAARNTSTFHYSFKDFRKTLKLWLHTRGPKEQSCFISRSKTRLFVSWAYYAIADMLRAEVSFGLFNKEAQEKNLQAAIAQTKLLGGFTESLLVAYLRARKLEGRFRKGLPA